MVVSLLLIGLSVIGLGALLSHFSVYALPASSASGV